jgi:hypothetical protein
MEQRDAVAQVNGSVSVQVSTAEKAGCGRSRFLAASASCSLRRSERDESISLSLVVGGDPSGRAFGGGDADLVELPVELLVAVAARSEAEVGAAAEVDAAGVGESGLRDAVDVDLE